MLPSRRGERVPRFTRGWPYGNTSQRDTIRVVPLFLSLLNALATLAVTSNAMAQSIVPRENLWVTDGPVGVIVRTPSTIYIGGTFTGVGPYTGGFAAIDSTTGTASWRFPKVNGEVFSSAPDGSGGWYVGGYFTAVDGVARNSIARIDADGVLDAVFNPDIKGNLKAAYALAVSGNTVYVGGSFQEIGGKPRKNIAALNATTGAATAWNPEASHPVGDAVVYALAVSGNTVYAGGYFTTIGGQSRRHVAALDAATGAATPWVADSDHIVRVLALSGSTVYAGGYFAHIGGQARNRIAALDATTGAATAWNPNADMGVECLLISGSTVYAGGYFTRIGEQARNRIAALDAVTGIAAAWNPDADGGGGRVSALAISGDKVYVSGDFTRIGGQERNYIAELNVENGGATSWNPNTNANLGGGSIPSINTIAVLGNTIYAGGAFRSIGIQQRTAIAALDAATGAATDWNPNVSGGTVLNGIFALVISGNMIYVGGDFTRIGGQERRCIAALDAATGAATDWNPHVSGGKLFDQVYALVKSGNTIYVGGDFTRIGGQERHYIAAIDAATGAARDWNPNASDEEAVGYPRVSALAVSGNVLYAGGYFTRIGGQPRVGLAALDTATGSATDWNPNAYCTINAIAVTENTVYAGGWFTSIGGQSWEGGLAALDAATGVATAWNPGVDSWVDTVAVSGSTVYAGGWFRRIGQRRSQEFVAAWDVTSNEAKAWKLKYRQDSEFLRPQMYISAISVSSESIIIGGDFTLSPSGHSNLAEFAIDGTDEGSTSAMAQALFDAFDILDSNADGRLSDSEAAVQNIGAAQFYLLDANSDGFLTRVELIAAGAVEVQGVGCNGSSGKVRLEKLFGDMSIFAALAILLIALGAIDRRLNGL